MVVLSAWLAVLLAAAGRTHHSGAWLAMPIAMMVPTTLPVVRYLTRNTLRRRRAVGLFLAGYLLIWSGYGILLHAGTAVHSGTLVAAAFAVAAVWQLSPAKAALLAGCRSVAVLPAHGIRADLAALRLGLRHGTGCLGACWAVMLAVSTVAIGQTGWMILATGLVWAERVHSRYRQLALPSAAVLALAATVYFVL